MSMPCEFMEISMRQVLGDHSSPVRWGDGVVVACQDQCRYVAQDGPILARVRRDRRPFLASREQGLDTRRIEGGDLWLNILGHGIRLFRGIKGKLLCALDRHLHTESTRRIKVQSQPLA